MRTTDSSRTSLHIRKVPIPVMVDRSKRTRPLSHRPIFKIHSSVWGRAADEFSDKGASYVVLLDRAKTSRNQTPQPSDIARRVSIACDNSRTKNHEALEAYSFDRLFFQPHDSYIADPAFRAASHGRKQTKLCDTSSMTTAAKPPTAPISSAFNSSSLHFMLP